MENVALEGTAVTRPTPQPARRSRAGARIIDRFLTNGRMVQIPIPILSTRSGTKEERDICLNDMVAERMTL
jgi:hypothetical protein